MPEYESHGGSTGTCTTLTFIPSSRGGAVLSSTHITASTPLTVVATPSTDTVIASGSGSVLPTATVPVAAQIQSTGHTFASVSNRSISSGYSVSTYVGGSGRPCATMMALFTLVLLFT